MAKTPYAKNTTVTVKRSMAEIENMVERFGVSMFLKHRDPDTGAYKFLAFEIRGHPFKIAVPEPDREKIRASYRRSFPSADQLDRAVERERMRLWRVIVQQVKAMLVAVDEGLYSFEQAMMFFHVLPGGQTVHEALGERIEGIYDSGLLLLPGGEAEK